MRTRSLWTAVWMGLIPLAAGLGLVSPARAGGIAPDLARKIQAHPGSTQLDQVIVQFTQRGVDSGAAAHAFGGLRIADLPLINGAILLVPRNAIQGLSNNPLVAWISPDRKA